MNDYQNNSRIKAPRVLTAVGFLVLIALAVFLYWYLFMKGIVFSDDARLGGHLVDLAPEVNGTLLEVSLKEGDRVQKGQKVVQNIFRKAQVLGFENGFVFGGIIVLCAAPICLLFKRPPIKTAPETYLRLGLAPPFQDG